MANYGSTIWPAALLDMSKEYGRFPHKKRRTFIISISRRPGSIP